MPAQLEVTYSCESVDDAMVLQKALMDFGKRAVLKKFAVDNGVDLELSKNLAVAISNAQAYIQATNTAVCMVLTLSCLSF